MVAYNELVKCGTQIAASGSDRETGLGITAATNNETGVIAVVVSNFDDEKLPLCNGYEKYSASWENILFGIRN